jgi:hypothetical protein
VHFQTSCTPQAQQKFDRGLAMVHSFVYPDSVAAFTEAAAADPECAVAYWGIAISHRPNPLILPLSAAALKNGLAAVEKGKAIGAKTERERDWLAAIELYYKDYDKVDQTARGLAYEKAMERLMQKYPDDPEAAIFYALALNETAAPSDKTYANQLKAGAILEQALVSQPDHPGALHYLIHSYDYTPLAPRALAAANKYAGTAPAAPHAQHMPAHTYSMLGLWAQSVESNTKSREAAQEQAARLWPGATHFAVPHHLDFMEYALLQMGQEQRAKQVRDDNSAIKKLGLEIMASYTALAAVPARFALERQAWKEAAVLEPRGSQFPQAEAITYFARAIGAARSGDWPPRTGSWLSSKNCAPRWKRRTSPIGPSKSKSKCWRPRPGSPMPMGRRTRRSSSCAPRQTWRITAQSTSPWRIGSTRCANCWATSCCNSNNLHRH